MNPFYFGSSKEPLFGIYHPPLTTGIQNSAILICPPLGREYIRTHWALRRLAEQLARAGSHILRFDYFGNGDSAGKSDEGNVGRWQNDIRIAANELLELSGAQKVSIVALRAGAALAATTNKLDISKLILWDPVITGYSYLDGLQHVYQTKLEVYNKIRGQRVEQTADELLGFPLPPSMRSSIEQLNILSGFHNKADKVHVFSSRETNELFQLEEFLNQCGNTFCGEIISDAGDWDQASKVGDAFLPTRIPAAIVNTFKEK